MEPETNSMSEQSGTTASSHEKPERRIAAQNLKKLPYSGWWPVIAGALLGTAHRLIFSANPGFPYAAMDSAFLLFAPLAVGAVTVYVAETKARRSWGYYIWAPVLANALFVMGTMAILIEGIICAIVIAPLFALMGAIGGVAMGAICRITNWPKRAVYSFAVLPLILGALPPDESSNKHIAHIERSIVIPVAADKVWHQLHDVRDIKPEEVKHAWMYRIGVPLPIAGVTQVTPEGLVRKVVMGKSIHFDQVATDWKVNQYVKWRYRFYDDSFPPNALDDHVMIGGHYFDIIGTEYSLVPIDANSTALNTRMSYRVSTEFNWYANFVAQLLIGNFEEVILNFYRDRSIGGQSTSS